MFDTIHGVLNPDAHLRLEVRESGVVFCGDDERVVVFRREHLHVVIDQSSSMTSVQNAVYSGAKELVKEAPDTAQVTFTTFANTVVLGNPKSKPAFKLN